MAVERSAEEQEKLDLLSGKITRYRSRFEPQGLPKEEGNELYTQIIDLTARLLIDRKGKEGHGLLDSVANRTDSLGLANERYRTKIWADVACRIAEIASE